MKTRRLLFALLALAAVLVLAPWLAGCGGEEPTTVKVTAKPSEKPSGLSTYRAVDWGYSLRYDAAAYELQSNETGASLSLGPSLFTGKPLDLAGLPDLNVSLLATPADEGAATPAFSVAARRLPFSVGQTGEGLSTWVRDDLLEQIETAWGDVLTDEPRQTEVGGVALGWTFEAVGFDEAAGAELHLRAFVAAYGGFLYTLRLSAPRQSWDQVEPQLTAIADSFAIDAETADPGPAPRERRLSNDEYGFSLQVPKGLVTAQKADDPTPDLLFGVQFVDVQTTPLIALSVGVAGAPEGIGNSQARLLRTFYRDAVEQLREQPGVVSVEEAKEVDLGGDTAWVLDVTRRLADGRRLRTRTYDRWHNDFVYSVSARGRADQWAADWQLLEPAVLSFRVD